MSEHKNPYEAPQANIPLNQSIEYTSLHSSHIIKNIKGLGIALIVLLTLNLLITATIAGVSFYAAEGFDNGDNVYFGSFGASTQLNTIISTVERLDIIVHILTIIIFCFWIHRAMNNSWYIKSQNQACILDSKHPLITPGWAIGWFFIPIAMLWMPFKGMYQIWQITFNNKLGVVLLRFWWAAFLIASLISNNLRHKDPETMSELATYSYMLSFSSASWVAAAVCLILIVRAISWKQTETMDKYYSPKATPSVHNSDSPYST